jgi:hypothetical protein
MMTELSFIAGFIFAFVVMLSVRILVRFLLQDDTPEKRFNRALAAMEWMHSENKKAKARMESRESERPGVY